MRLQPAIKTTDDGAHRVVPLHETYRHIQPLLRRIGMTEHDLTDYHGVAIPVWSVQQQHDVSHQRTAYGKGVSHIQSRVSAMMEAIERYSAEQLPRTLQCASYREMCQQKVRTSTPQQITDGVGAAWSENVVIEWLPGTDLNTQEEVWVPASCVLLHPEPVGPRFIPIRTSNGLASGNTLEEAICHSLYEMIERDAWSLAWLRAVTIPHTRRIAPLLVQHPGTAPWSDSNVVSDWDLFPAIDRATLPDNVCQIVDLFERAGITVIIRDITSDIGIPTFVAMSKEIGLDGNDVICYGTGTHFSAQMAVVRALTECAQKRTIAIREIYEDRTGGRPVNTDTHMLLKIIPFALTGEKREFTSIPIQYNRNIADDIAMMLTRLSEVGLYHVIAVNLTLPKLNVPVVRVIIPDIEDWSAFDFSPRYCMLGFRGKGYLNGS